MKVIKHLSNFASAHIYCLIFFAVIYYILLFDIDKHFVIYHDIPKTFYTNNKMLHALYISASLQASIGYIELVSKSIISKYVFTCHTIITILITLHIIHIFITK